MVFTAQEFRDAYPEFSDITDDVILSSAIMAGIIIALRCVRLDNLAQMAMTAHLLVLSAGRRDGSAGAGRVGSATIDKVSVTYMEPQGQTEFSLWLGSTPYGQLVLAAIAACSVGGFYVGGRPELAAIRRQR